MIILQLAGGLGNQMFQYALYLQLKSLGREVKIDDVSGFVQDTQRKPALAPFGITYGRPDKKEMQKMLDSSMLPWDRVRRKLFGRHKKAYFEESKLFLPKILEWDDIYLEGYWQSEKYFWKNGDLLRRVYDTNKLVQYLLQKGVWERCIEGQKSAAQYAMGINNTCSVSVHVRRGDYLTPENQALFGGICTEAYYMEGMRLMRERYPGCSFYLFCNDKDWARENFAGQEDVTLVDLPGSGEDSVDGEMDLAYAEFVLMSRCKHHILANSSFSWWASYLNANPDKTVLVPDTWLNGTDCRDFYREDMQKIASVIKNEKESVVYE